MSQEGDAVVDELLGSVPRGEEIIDPRTGDHPEAKLVEVELVEQSGGYAIVGTFGGLTDREGTEFSYKERWTVPTANSEDWMKGRFLSALHDLGIVSRQSKASVYAETDEHRRELLDAFKSKVGLVVPLRIRESDGFLKARILRRK